MGGVIGVGIFLTPGEMVTGLASPALLLAVWLVVGATCFCGALCYGELAARFPAAGGGYIYLREAFGPGVAFLYGWKCLLVMDPGLTAALAAGLAQYVLYLAPISPAGAKAVAIGTVLVLAAVNAVGLGRAAAALRALTALKLLLLGLLVVWGFASGRGDFGHFLPFFARPAEAAPLVPALAGAVIAAFFSFGGFWDVVKIASEVRDPTRTLPRALAIGVGTVTLIYILTSAVFVYLVPIGQATSGTAFAARVGEVLFGPAGGWVFAAIVVVAVAGALTAVLLMFPRVYFAMARDGAFLHSVAQVHPRYGTPVRAIALQAVLACLLVGLGTFGEIVAYFIFVAIAFIALTVAGLYRLPRPQGDIYRVPGYPWTPLAFLALLTVLLVLLGGGRPRQAALGTLVVALGVPAYQLFVMRRRRDPVDVPWVGEEN